MSPPPRSPRSIWVGELLRPGWLRSRRLSRGQGIARTSFLLLGVGIAVAIYFTAVWFLDLCYQVEVVGPMLCRRLLEIVLMVLSSVLLLSNIVTALSSFFLAEDLELLCAAPVPPRPLFAARFLQQLFQSSAMVLAFGLPVLLAFARVAGGPATYAAVLLVLPPLIVISGALGTVVVLLLVSLLPASRVRSLVVALLFITFLVLYLALRLMEPERLLNPEGFASLITMLTSLSGPSSTLLPPYWGSEVLAVSFRDAPGLDSGWGLRLAALWTGAGASWTLASVLFRRLHAVAFSHSMEGRNVAQLSRLWARLRGRPLPDEGRIRAPGRRAPAIDWIRAFASVVPPGAYREMLVKDAKLLLRDASQWSQLVLLLALVFVYLYNFRHFRQIGDAGLVSGLPLYLVGLALAGFVTAAVSVRFAFPLVSREGRVMWLLRSAPLRPRQLLASKLLATLPPLVLVAESLSLVSALILGVPARMVLFSGGVAALTALAVGSLSVGLGAFLPDYRAESAAKVAASFGGLVCMSVALVTALTLVALSFYPAYLLNSGVVSPRGPLLAGCLGGMILTTSLSVLVPLRLGERALSRLES
jgi:ABC-2 type transport system permease protein